MDIPSTPPSPVQSASSGVPAAGAAGATWRRLRRFIPVERVSHWLYALFFLVALVSGLLMWIPATREWMAGSRRTVTLYHGYVGAAMVILPILIFIIVDRRRLVRDLREVDKWSGEDRRWLTLALRGNTLHGREMPPQGRFNAGQKLNVVFVAAMAVGFSVTGGILMHKEDMPPWLVSRSLWLHDILVVAAIALFLGHLAHVLFTKHGRTYLAGMIKGWIPEALAQERHLRWWEEETGNAVRSDVEGDAIQADAEGSAGRAGDSGAGDSGDTDGV
jgi:formate dehydrogenase subunit gamma